MSLLSSTLTAAGPSRGARLTAVAPPPFILLTPHLTVVAESIAIVVAFHRANRCCVHRRLAPLPRTAASHRIVPPVLPSSPPLWPTHHYCVHRLLPPIPPPPPPLSPTRRRDLGATNTHRRRLRPPPIVVASYREPLLNLVASSYRASHYELGNFNGEESPPPASEALSRDGYTMIFYPPANVAVGGGFRPSAFPTMGLEYVGGTRVYEFE
ncbi:hypothetical protein Syun_021394 [Stephania yunnanensis]|uniref:Uncharacterized protein n=1 Tax=Stephania yunnanensis TaxID=152371 RepID=A0AAP0IFX5_9MAGN